MAHEALANLSDGDLIAWGMAVQAEADRRKGEAEADRQFRFQREMAEIEAGKRLAQAEHVRAASNETVSRWAREGRCAGVAAAKRQTPWWRNANISRDRPARPDERIGSDGRQVG